MSIEQTKKAIEALPTGARVESIWVDQRELFNAKLRCDTLKALADSHSNLQAAFQQILDISPKTHPTKEEALRECFWIARAALQPNDICASCGIDVDAHDAVGCAAFVQPNGGKDE